MNANVRTSNRCWGGCGTLCAACSVLRADSMGREMCTAIMWAFQPDFVRPIITQPLVARVESSTAIPFPYCPSTSPQRSTNFEHLPARVGQTCGGAQGFMYLFNTSCMCSCRMEGYLVLTHTMREHVSEPQVFHASAPAVLRRGARVLHVH